MPVTMPPCGDALDPATFFGVPWRTVITDLDSGVITFLDRLASDRTVEFTLNAPAIVTGKLPSDNPEVNIAFDADDEPFVSYSNRLLYMFRREGTPTCWVCRFGGVVMQLQDQGASDNASTTYTAFDPWQVLYHRPVITADGNSLLGPNGITYKGTTADVIVDDLMTNMWAYETAAGSAHPDAFIDFGQTAFYTGTMETAHDVQWMNFDQSTSVGDALSKLCESGMCDIILEPVYDINRPGIVAQMSVYMPPAGSHRNSMIMAWDKPSRSLTGIDALYDGASIVNRTKYSQNQGPPVDLLDNLPSVAKYGSYWEQTMFTGDKSLLNVLFVMQSELILRGSGKTTYKVNPVPGRSPIPFVEYGLGDQLPVYASSKMRQEIGPTLTTGQWAQMSRVYGITVTLSDDETEQVELTLSKDGDF